MVAARHGEVTPPRGARGGPSCASGDPSCSYPSSSSRAMPPGRGRGPRSLRRAPTRRPAADARGVGGRDALFLRQFRPLGGRGVPVARASRATRTARLIPGRITPFGPPISRRRGRVRGRVCRGDPPRTPLRNPRWSRGQQGVMTRALCNRRPSSNNDDGPRRPSDRRRGTPERERRDDGRLVDRKR